MPRFDGATLNRVLILPPGWEKGGPVIEQYLVEGSDKTPNSSSPRKALP